MLSRLLPLVGILVLGLLAGGCGRGDAPAGGAKGTPIKLGFLVKQPEEPWFQYEWQGAEMMAKELGFELLKYGVPDGEKVMAAIDNLAVSGAQGFVICTPDVRLGPQIMQRANQRGLKVIAIDDRFVRRDGSFMEEVPYLGMSATAVGRTVGAELFAEMKRRGWSVEETGVCVVTFEELDTARDRTDGAIAALKEQGFPAERIFKAAQKTTDVPGSFVAASDLLTRQPDVKHWLIAGMNDSAVMGAVRAMEGRGFAAADVIGIGINGTDCVDELRKPNPTGFHGSMLISAQGEGRRTSEMLYHWVKDGAVPPLDTRTDGELITRANCEEVWRREGIVQ